MAVLKNKRTPNPLAYETVFQEAYDQSSERISMIPKRRWKYVAEPLLEHLNAAYIAVMGIGYDPVRGKPDYMAIKQDRIRRAISELLAIQGPLYVYWAVSNDKHENLMRPRSEESRRKWVDSLNHVINMLAAMLQDEAEKPSNPLRWYTNREVRESLLLGSMRSLLLETQRRVIRLPLGARDANGLVLTTLMADAWYHAVEGNRLPRNKTEALAREKHISALISDISKANRPMFTVFASGTISEEDMAKWANLLKETNDLAYRIQASDKKRFQSLK